MRADKACGPKIAITLLGKGIFNEVSYESPAFKVLR